MRLTTRIHKLYGVVLSPSSAPSEIFRDRLRDVRELRKLSQSELADRSGLKPAAISHFETGARKPSFENLKRLADALEVSVDYLLGRVDELAGSASGDPEFFRNFEQLSSDDRALAKSFLADLAKRNK